MVINLSSWEIFICNELKFTTSYQITINGSHNDGEMAIIIILN